MSPIHRGPGALAGATEAIHNISDGGCSPDGGARQAPANCRDTGDSITILRARGRRLAKLIGADGSITDYDSARLYDLAAVELSGLKALGLLLQRLAHRPDCCIVRDGIAGPRRTRKDAKAPL
jgi:hypothetical protein